MFSEGNSDIKLEPDKWTISTQNGKIAALFEETVAVKADGPLILTK